MYNKKIATLAVMTAIITATTFTACGSNSAKTNTISFAETSFTGTVESVDDNTVTLSVNTSSSSGMDMQPGENMGGGPSDSQGTPPEMPGSSSDGNSAAGSDSDANSSGGGDSSGNQSTPPAKPEDSSSAGNTGTSGNTADGSATDANNGGSSGSQSTPPAKPEDSSSDGNSETSGSTATDSSADANNGGSGDSSGNQSTPPTKPGDSSSDEDSATSGNTAADANNGDSEDTSDTKDSSSDKDASSSDSEDTITVTLTINDDSVLTDDEDKAVEVSDIEEGDYITVTIDDEGNIESIVVSDEDSSQQNGGPGSSNASISYTALKEITEATELKDETIESTGTDENAIYIHGADATLDNVTVSRDSDDSTGGDNSSFYGVGAAILNTEGTTVIKNSTITTDAAGGAGVFSYGDGVTYVSDSTIKTQQDTSGGIHVAGGGTLYAWNLDVETNGQSSAAIRSDRGGGTMVVDGGTYTSNGVGSPAVYCTADIAINDAELTANGSEAVCIEGLNSLNLYDCQLTGNMSDDSQNDCTWNVIVYQSMSGDSEVGNGTFNMTGGSITAKNGGMFYTTNTECTFYLSNVDITYADDNDFFLRCTGNNNQRGWGTVGSNGSQCTFTADDQEMEGDIIYDSVSTLDFYMENGSILTGAVVDDESCAGNGGDGYCNLYISKDSKWVVTGNSTVSNLYSEGTIVDSDGKTVSIVGTDGTVYVQGSSSYTITVGSYSSSVDMSGATDGGSFSDYEVEQK